MARFFLTPEAEYRASRIAQLLQPHRRVAALRDGTVVANFNGHLFTFALENGSLKQISDQTADIQVRQEPTTTVEITGP
jgi:hypothetical protein